MIKPIAKTANYKTAVLAPYIERWTVNGEILMWLGLSRRNGGPKWPRIQRQNKTVP